MIALREEQRARAESDPGASLLFCLAATLGFIFWAAFDHLFGTQIVDAAFGMVSSAWWIVFFPWVLFVNPEPGLRALLGLIILLAPAAVLVAAVACTVGNQDNSGSASVPFVSKPLPPIISTFYDYAFDLQEADFRILRFDGEEFYMPAPVPLAQVISIELRGSRYIDNAPITVDHAPIYLHSCRDGTRDLRYRDNPIIARRAFEYTIVVKCADGVEATFAYYERCATAKVESSVYRMNRMLVLARRVNVALAMNEYRNILADAGLLDVNGVPNNSRWEDALSQRRALERLGAGGGIEAEKCAERLSEIERRMAEMECARRAARTLVQQLRADSERAFDAKVTGMPFEPTVFPHSQNAEAVLSRISRVRA
jgi:hypothetical protein